MKQDRFSVVGTVAEPAGHVLDGLDFVVESFGRCVGDSMLDECQDIGQMSVRA